MSEQTKHPSKKQQKQNKQEEKSKHHPQPQKKQEESSSQSENADIDLNQLEGGVEQMQVSFIVGEIQEDYYHSLKTILLRYAQITKTTNSELADALVANRTVGNVVLADDDDEEDEEEEDEQEEQEGEDDQNNVYSVLSILSSKSGVGKKIRSIVLKSIEKKDFPEEITNILKDPTTSVLLNQRLPNLPAFVATSSHEVFKKDLLQLKQRSPTEYANLLGPYLLNVSEVQFEGEQDLEKLIYSKFEDYEMCQRARVWWLGGTNASHRRKADMRNLYYLITPEEYLQAADKLKSYLAE